MEYPIEAASSLSIPLSTHLAVGLALVSYALMHHAVVFQALLLFQLKYELYIIYNPLIFFYHLVLPRAPLGGFSLADLTAYSTKMWKVSGR